MLLSIRRCVAPAALAVLIMLTGCSSLPGSGTTRAGAGTVEVSKIAGAGPAVLFEAGLASHKESWGTVFTEIGTSNAVFAYNRPGTGRSLPTTRRRDGLTIVEDLRQLLKAERLTPPYVLVGHSAGGLYMQLYARLYPDEVAGLVLVDPTHPTQFEGDGALDRRPGGGAAMVVMGMVGPAGAEFAALAQTGQQVLAAPALRKNIPTVILVAPDRSGTPIAAFDNAKRANFAKLYPAATLREVEGGHHLAVERPEVVIEAIRQVLR